MLEGTEAALYSDHIAQSWAVRYLPDATDLGCPSHLIHIPVNDLRYSPMPMI